MCRFLAYMGTPVIMESLLYEPNNSLIRQSYQAHEREEPLNGDGFGVGWYNKEITADPAVFTDINPAWSNRNLRSISTSIESGCIFAHVRAASKGEVARANCHPFEFDNLLFMHNGDIGEFRKIKRPMRAQLSDELYHWIQGTTDSEHFFALFLDNLYQNGTSQSREAFRAALEESIAQVNALRKKFGVTEPMQLNAAITDGNFIVATRYVSDPAVKPNTLYHSEGSRYECHDGICHMVQAGSSEHAVLIVSEKLTDVKEDWHEVPANHVVTVKEDLTIAVDAIKA